jgi:hypothetical protein
MFKTEKTTNLKVSELIEHNRGNTKQLYRIVNSEIGNKKPNPMPENKSDKDLADQFANFFLDKIKRIRDDLEDHDLYVPDDKDVPILSKFKPVDMNDVKGMIMSM